MTADADTDSRTFAAWTAIENDRDDLRGPLRFRRLRFLRFAAAVAGAEAARDSRRVDADESIPRSVSISAPRGAREEGAGMTPGESG